MLAVLASALLAMEATAGSPGAAYAPRKTPWGDPDLRGMWPLDTVGQTPMQRPEQFGARATLTDDEYAALQKKAAQMAKGADKEDKANKLGIGHWTERGQGLRQTSLIVEPRNGRIPPLTETGKKRAAAMKSSWSEKAFDGLADFNTLDRCITRGMPASMVPFPYNNGVRIFQGPGWVAINLEIVHETRLIPLDRRGPLPETMARWMGDSRGHFEGNTLVIETTNFNGIAPMVIVGPASGPIPTSRAMRIVERLTPTGPDTIQYEAFVSDPEDLTGPWKMAFPWTRNERYQAFEYACHEGNTLIPGYIRSTSPRYEAYRRQRNAALTPGGS